MIYLCGVEGPLKGKGWSIAEEPLLLGRALDCDIIISDPTVSRRHCEIVWDDSQIHFRNLSRTNVSLLNGVNVSESPIKPGDTLAVGSALFVVTTVGDPPRVKAPEGDADDTIESGIQTPIYLLNEEFELSFQGRPRTLRDLARLYDLGRTLARARTTAELMEGIGDCLTERFPVRNFWVGRFRSEIVDLDFQVELPGESIQEPPPDAVYKDMRRAGKEQRALLFHKKTRSANNGQYVTSVLAAPMSVSGEHLGVIGLESEPSPLGLQRAELEFLLAVAHQAAPFFLSVEQAERQRHELENLRARAGESTVLVGNSRSIGQVRSLIRTAAATDLNTLVLGETGTGKELAARMLHENSARSNNPFMVINCAAIPPELLESELFGYEKGAFTGAAQRRIGYLEQTNGGTLFLDEIGDLSPENQARILRVLEQKSFYRLGGNQEQVVDIRFVAATNCDIAVEVRRGGFRHDLYHRLNGFEIHIPPLRRRPSDIPLLAEHFLKLGMPQARKPIQGIEPSAMDWLVAQPWRGNVRELRNTIYRALVLGRGPNISVSDLTRFEHSTGGEASAPMQTLADLEREHIQHVVESSGNISAAARVLGISRTTLYKKLNEYGITAGA